MWLEPTASHLTSSTVLAEEESVLCWAMESNAAEPAPSSTVGIGDLDVLQADAAAAAAGYDRLALIVGPAGAGKTSTLRAAVADLVAHRRSVFGLAPSAKAARVLQRDAGLRADTVAKLLHEWERGDRLPLLPAVYVAEHVRLGYAATEHGNQSDTVTIGLQLVTAATTRRGLYVGATAATSATKSSSSPTSRTLTKPATSSNACSPQTPSTSPPPRSAETSPPPTEHHIA